MSETRPTATDRTTTDEMTLIFWVGYAAIATMFFLAGFSMGNFAPRLAERHHFLVSLTNIVLAVSAMVWVKKFKKKLSMDGSSESVGDAGLNDTQERA